MKKLYYILIVLVSVSCHSSKVQLAVWEDSSDIFSSRLISKNNINQAILYLSNGETNQLDFDDHGNIVRELESKNFANEDTCIIFNDYFDNSITKRIHVNTEKDDTLSIRDYFYSSGLLCEIREIQNSNMCERTHYKYYESNKLKQIIKIRTYCESVDTTELYIRYFDNSERETKRKREVGKKSDVTKIRYFKNRITMSETNSIYENNSIETVIDFNRSKLPQSINKVTMVQNSDTLRNKFTIEYYDNKLLKEIKINGTQFLKAEYITKN